MELDLHIHSKYSFDSAMEIRRIIDIAIDNGLNGIAVTDHNTFEGSIKALEYAPKGFFVIPGIEISTTWGDILGLFCDFVYIETRTPLEVIEAIHNQEGIAVIPHPLRKHMQIKPQILQSVDAIEAFNARATKITEELPLSHGEPRVQAFLNKHKMPITAGSDAHSYPEIGAARLVLPDCNSLEEIRAAILAGKGLVKGNKTSKYLVALTRMKSFFGR